jgi:hypothetical protein
VINWRALAPRFTFHPATPQTAPLHDKVRELGHFAAAELLRLCPQSDELVKAIDAIDLAVMHANAAIARHGGIPQNPSAPPAAVTPLPVRPVPMPTVSNGGAPYEHGPDATITQPLATFVPAPATSPEQVPTEGQA